MAAPAPLVSRAVPRRGPGPGGPRASGRPVYTEAGLSEEMATRVKIPARSIYKPNEVCTIAGLQPYVLRSWEAEFPEMGVAHGESRSRLYRREDLDRVLRIKELVFTKGLTLGAARRKLLKEAPAVENTEAPALDQLLGEEVRARLNGIKKGLNAILDLLAEQKA